MNDTDLKSVWIGRLQREDKAHKDYREQAKKSEEAYRDELRYSNEKINKILFPIWWSTAQITHAAVFAKPPKPDVRRRYSTTSKANDRIAQAVERSLQYTIDTTGFTDHAHKSMDDYLIAACGVARVEIDTVSGTAPVMDPLSGEPIAGEDGEPVMQKMIVSQKLRLQHFHWSKFRWEPSADWESCDWVAFVHDLTTEEVKAQFGKELDGYSESADSPMGMQSISPRRHYKDTHEVFEVWDRKKKRVLFITDDYEEPLQVNDDPLGLENFYPCPKPAFLNLATDRLIPKPDYCFIESQCTSINILTGRIQSITKQVKDVGFYDQQLQELARLTDAADGDRIPIKNLMERLNKATRGDFDQVLAVQDNTGKVNVLRELLQQRDVEKQIVFETLGISDIIRGATVASETAEAQKLKSQWGNVRIGPKISAIGQFFRDIFRIMAEILCEHFEPEQINAMSGMELTPEEFQTMKDDLARCYAIDVETDSTIAADDADERAQRLEMVKTLTDYLNVYLPMAQQNLIPPEMAKETISFVVSAFKHGRELQDAVANMPDGVQKIQQMQQQLEQMQQQLEQSQMQGEQLQKQLEAAKTEDLEIKRGELGVAQMEAEGLTKLRDAQTLEAEAAAQLKQADAAQKMAALGAESEVSEAAGIASQATQYAAASMGDVVQRFADILPMLEMMVAKAAIPKAKVALVQRLPEGGHVVNVIERQEDEGPGEGPGMDETPMHEQAESPTFESGEGEME